MLRLRRMLLPGAVILVAAVLLIAVLVVKPVWLFPQHPSIRITVRQATPQGSLYDALILDDANKDAYPLPVGDNCSVDEDPDPQVDLVQIGNATACTASPPSPLNPHPMLS